MYLELGIVVPDFFYNKGRLIEASGNERKGQQAGSSHHKVTALCKQSMVSKQGMIMRKPLSMKVSSCHLRLREIFALMTMVLDGSSKSLLMINEELFQMHQCYFVLSVELQSIIKPCKSKNSGKKALRFISSPIKPTQDYEDPYNDEDSEFVMQT